MAAAKLKTNPVKITDNQVDNSEQGTGIRTETFVYSSFKNLDAGI